MQKTSGARYSPTDCTDVHRLGGYGIPAIPTQPQNYLPTEFTEHTETTGGEEKSVYICEIRGRISSARNFCEFREFRGRTCANKLGVGSVEGIRRAAWVWQPQNYLPTEFAEHTETTGGEEKSVYICEIRGRLFYARSFCVFCEIRGRISSTRNFCEFREFRGRTCANKLGVGSMEGIRRAAWVWQGCHTLLRKLPRIARMCTD